MNNTKTTNAVVNAMMRHDIFSQWLGIEILSAEPGSCKLTMIVRPEMCNGFRIAHGGIAYSLADSALAFASNAHGKKAVSIETSISHLKPIQVGEILTATAAEKHLSERLAIYEISIARQDESIVALFKGTVYRKDEEWQNDPQSFLRTT